MVLLLLFFNLTWGQTAPKPKNYSCITAHFNTTQWLGMHNRAIDSTGILTQNKQYHALSIAIWGIMNYHEYQATANKDARAQVINQYRYFCDTALVEISKDRKYMGLPYRFKFHDLNAPWYSGMTQGVALSFLYRYYDLTKDKTALVKMQQVAQFMLRTQDNKGTIGKTPEGYLWIEEYPNSKKSPQVLNGFINGLIGLAEYLEVFPGDTAARRVHNAAYQSLLNTLHKYDTPTWTNYNRTNSGVTNEYMRYQLTQMEHLLYYYGDSAFYRQMMIWSPMAVNKFDTRTQFYKAPRYQFAIALDSSKTIGGLQTSKLFEDSLKAIPGGIQLRKKHYAASDSLSCRLRAGATHQISWQNEVRFIRLGFDTLFAELPEIWVRKGTGSWKRAAVQSQNGTLWVQAATPFTAIRFHSGKRRYQLRHITSLPHNYAIPKFLFYKFRGRHYLSAGQLYQLSAQTRQIVQANVFYRYADKPEQLAKQIWKQEQCVQLNGTFVPPAEGYYEFYICFPYYFPAPEVKNFDVLKI
ncbi:MAG: hypothetical protein IM638_00905 [Bacteroidetes bacterium]|nr:hypothetical protein [Bacteroidota bacterium]